MKVTQHPQLGPVSDNKTYKDQTDSFSRGLDYYFDMYGENGNIIVEMQIAGVNPESLALDITENVLHIKGQLEEAINTEKKHFYKKEIRRGPFERTIVLPINVQADTAQATLHNGLLKIILPKEETQNVHTIKVKSVT